MKIDSGESAMEVGTGAKLNLNIEGENSLKSGSFHAGLQVGDGETLVISGNGSLHVTGSGYAAGIGGGSGESGGNIIILSGTVTAIGGNNGVKYPIVSLPSECGFHVTGGVYGTDYKYQDGVLKVLTDTALTIEGKGSVTTDQIKIEDGITANVTLKDVNIDISSQSDRTAFEVVGSSKLNLTLEGTNTLKSGAYWAGLNVREDVELVVTENSTGSLESVGGYNAAGIGGSWGCKGGTITITGGTVIATASSGSGAGIGGGCDAAGGDVTISGGTVTATGSGSGAAIGNGDGSSDSGTFSTGTNGNAILNVSVSSGSDKLFDLISDTSPKNNWSATINGVSYPMTSLPSTCGFTVTGGVYGVDYDYDGRLTILTDTALTIEGKGSPTTDTIKIKDGITANVTIKNVNIDVSSQYNNATDADMAKEMVEHAKNNILMQVSQSMLAQSKQDTQGVLQLLQ